MIIKKLIFIKIIFLSITAFSQNLSGIAVYIIKPTYFKSFEKSEKSDIFKILQDKANKSSKNTTYELSFNNSQSVFVTKNNHLNVDETNFGKRLLNSGLIFNNAEGLKITQKKRSGTTFLIQSNSRNIKWRILNVTKKIGKYTCYKATTKNEAKNGKHQVITAWYCPEIPVSFGPMGFANLPGLILELKIEGRGIYTLKTINLNKNIEIKKPTKGKKVTEEEYLEISKEMYYQHTTR